LRRSEAIEGKHPARTSREVAQQLLGPASWQCSSSRVSHCATVFGFYEDDTSPNLPTHWTSRRVHFSYPQRWNWSSRGSILTALKRSRPNHKT
jgi:hypothetical protein